MSKHNTSITIDELKILIDELRGAKDKIESKIYLDEFMSKIDSLGTKKVIQEESEDIEPENTDLLQERESDLKQLTNGLIFKNWKEVCGFMGWKETGGDYKKAKLKELDTMCKWHKEGNKIVVDEVYENNVKFEDNTRARKGKYNIEVGSSILAVVASKEDNDGVVYLTQKELIVQTALANGRLFSDYYAEGFSKLEVISYKDIAKKMTYKAIDNGLKWLNSARVLKNDKVKIGNVLNSETGEYELRELDSKELSLIHI